MEPDFPYFQCITVLPDQPPALRPHTSSVAYAPPLSALLLLGAGILIGMLIGLRVGYTRDGATR